MTRSKLELGVVLFLYERELNIKQINALNRLFDIIDGEKTVYIDKSNKQSQEDIINKTKEYLNRQDIEYVFRGSNYGIQKNIIEGISDLALNNKYVLVIEDDIVFEENIDVYIDLINNYIFDRKENDVQLSLWSFMRSNELFLFRSNHAHCWGWIVESDRWLKFRNLFDSKQKKILSEISFKSYLELTSNLSNYSQAFQITRNLLDKKKSWGIYWSVFVIENNYKIITPSFPLILNRGLEQGENYKTYKKYSYDDYTLADIKERFDRYIGVIHKEVSTSHYGEIIARNFSKNIFVKILVLINYIVIKIYNIK